MRYAGVMWVVGCLILAWPVHAQEAASRVVDATTFRGKVLCGYQGWFRCPGDAAGMGWIHWSRDRRRITPGSADLRDVARHDRVHSVRAVPSSRVHLSRRAARRRSLLPITRRRCSATSSGCATTGSMAPGFSTSSSTCRAARPSGVTRRGAGCWATCATPPPGPAGPGRSRSTWPACPPTSFTMS